MILNSRAATLLAAVLFLSLLAVTIACNATTPGVVAPSTAAATPTSVIPAAADPTATAAPIEFTASVDGLPKVGYLDFPAESADAGNFMLLAGSPIIISWIDAPAGAARYEFISASQRAEGTTTILGTDYDFSDGIAITWTVSERLAADLCAIAYLADGSMMSSSPSAIYSGEVPPEGVCTARATGIQPLDLFQEPFPDSTEFASLAFGKYAQVLDRTADGWYRVDAQLAVDQTGNPTTGAGWVSDHQNVAFYGPCQEVPVIGGSTPAPDATAQPSAANDYHNAEYGFSFSLPEGWEGYSIGIDHWEGLKSDGLQGEVVVEQGPIFSIIHPGSTAQQPRQDIPLMVFTTQQWDRLQQSEWHVGAAPVNPSELGRNNYYVFALPARYNYAFLEGWEEVAQILQGHPLQTFEPSVFP